MVDVGRERAEALLVGHDLAGQRHAHEGAAVEAAGEGDDGRAAGGGARDLDGVLDRLGAGGEEASSSWRNRHWRSCVQPLGQRDVALVGHHLEAGVA